VAISNIDVASVMRDSAILHSFGHLSGLAPDGLRNILLVFYQVFLALFQITISFINAIQFIN
jgi:hypothetical protein